MEKKSKKPASNRSNLRISLYGMKPEDALRKALSTPPPKNAANLPPEERAARSLPKPTKKPPKKG
jgi:hypothetical protein